MPIEIKELHLKFNVDGNAAASDSGTSAGTNADSGNCCNGGSATINQMMIQECVDEVLRVLDAKGLER